MSEKEKEKEPEKVEKKDEGKKTPSSLLDVIANVMSFITSSKTFFRIASLNKTTLQTFRPYGKEMTSYASSSKHVDFFFVSVTKEYHPYVQNLFLHKEYVVYKKFKFFKYFPAVTHLEVKHQYYFKGRALRQYRKQIKHLKIKWCDQFDGTDEKFPDLNTLKELCIHENEKVTEKLFSKTPSLEKLTVFNCVNVSTLKCDEEILKNLKGLKEVKITKCPKITDSLFESAEDLRKVKLKFCESITGSGLASRERKLQTLNLWSCDVFSDDNLNKNVLTEHLEVFQLMFCRKISGKFVKNEGICLKNLKDLKLINMDMGTKFINKILLLCVNLESLEMKKCKYVTHEGFENLGKLRVLKMHGLEEVSEECLKFLKNVVVMEVCYCGKFFGKNFELLKKLKKLTIKEGFSSNTLKYFCNFTDDLFSKISNVESLKLHCTKKIKGTEFIKVVNLKKLEIVDNDDVTDIIFPHLINLKSLNLKRCKKLEGKGLEELKNLKELKVKSCKGIPKSIIKKMKKDIKKKGKKK